MFILILFLITLSVQLNGGGVEGAKILFFIGSISSHSHRSSIQPLADKLAERGHSVTFFTPIKSPKGQHPSIKEFSSEELQKWHEEFLLEIGIGALQARIGTENLNEIANQVTQYFEKGRGMCENLLESPSFKSWLKNGEQFDLFVIDSALNTCAFGLADYFKSKIIIYNSLTILAMWDHSLFGVPSEISWIPSIASSSQGGHLTFLDRLGHAILIYSMSWVFTTYHLPSVEKLFKQNLGHEVNLEKVLNSTALMLINQHYSDQYARAFPPFVVPVGGLHLTDCNGSLPKEMADFLKHDEFVYISFGSLVNVESTPKYLLEIFFETLRESKIKFLMKFEGAVFENSPKNIFFHSWFPQKEVLAHPKIRAFITQGGQVSLQEAVYNGVPLIIFPVVGDQDFNARRSELMGNAIVMQWAGLTVSKLAGALENILTNPVYNKKAKWLAIASRKRPMTALDTGVWWVEHVIEVDDLSYLRPLSMGQPMWLQWGWDLWTSGFSCILIILFSFYSFLKFLLNKILSSCTNKVKDGTGKATKLKKS